MALTLEQEVALLALLDEKRITLPELTATAEIKADDLLLTNQLLADKSVTAKVLKDYIAPPASLDVKGVVQLSNAIDSANETTAATSHAAKKAYDFAAATSKAVALLSDELKATPFLPDFVSFDIENGIYWALGDGAPSPSLNSPQNSGNAVLTVTVRRRGKDVVHFEVIGTSHVSPQKWVGEYYKLQDGRYNFLWTKVITSADISEFMPVGIPQPWPSSLIPSNWLKCNGAAFDKAKYPGLAKVYPNGKLPDLRGEFIRGWDDGRGVDDGRTILSVQSDLFKVHGHTAQVAVNPAGDAQRHDLGYGVGGGDKMAVKSNTPTTIYGSPALVNSNGGSETRPRNVAFLYIVRAA